MSVSIAAIGVHSSLIGLSLNPDGSLQVPTDYQQAGWWRDGTVPGDPGAAIILGHVDSKSGPGVFFRLHSLGVGDIVQVARADGRLVTFSVDARREFAKANFPDEEVYGPTAAPTLRLITCGGTFDRATGHYLDNIVVFAHEIPPGTAALIGATVSPHGSS